jgi:hypothetical protein
MENEEGPKEKKGGNMTRALRDWGRDLEEWVICTFSFLVILRGRRRNGAQFP